MDTTPESRRSWLQRLLGITHHVTSEEHLQELIHASEEGGIINAEEGEMFSSIFEFGETIVREIMIPRTEMRSCPVDASLDTFIEMALKYGHSRIPVYEETIDRIVGLVYTKDLLKFWGVPSHEISLRDLMRKPYFVPETKRIEELLQEFRAQRMHIAIAIDEYGGTSGLITLEDLIEEIVGDIKDEYDLDDNQLLEETPGTIVVDARLSLDELEDYYDLPEFERDQFDSVGGLLLHRLGYVPKPGEEVAVDPLKMVVLQSDERMIHRIRVIREEAQERLLDE